MAFDVKGALAEGYSMSEIADHLASKSKFDIEGARQEGYSDSEIVSHLTTKRTAGMGEAFKGGAKRLGSSLLTGISAPFGAEEAVQKAQEREAKITERPGASLDEIKRLYEQEGLLAAGKEALTQIPAGLAEQAPFIGSMLAGGRLGAMAGSAVAPGIGTVIGGLGGAALAPFLSQAGSNVERQAAEQQAAGKPVNIDLTKAYGYAIPQAALDVGAMELGLGRALGIGVKQMGTRAAESKAMSFLKGSLQTGGMEIPSEIGQQMMERAQAGLDLTGPEAMKEYANVAYQAGLLAPVGGISRMATTPTALKEEPVAPAPTPITPEVTTPTVPTELTKSTKLPIEAGLETGRSLAEETALQAAVPGVELPEAATPTELAPEVAAPTITPSAVEEAVPPTELAPLTLLPNKIDDETIESFGFKPRTIAYKRMQEIDPTTPEGQELFDTVMINNKDKVKTDENVQAVNQFKSLIAEHNRLQEVRSAGADIRAIGTSIGVPGEPADTGGAGVTGEPIGGGVAEYRADMGRPEARTEPEYGALAEEAPAPMPEPEAPTSTEVLPTAEELMPEAPAVTEEPAAAAPVIPEELKQALLAEEVSPQQVQQEARKLAVKLQKIDPYHPSIPTLRSADVTAEDVLNASEEIAGLEQVPQVETVAPAATEEVTPEEAVAEDPLEKQIQDVKSNLGMIASDLFEPKAEMVGGPKSTINDLLKAIGDLMFLMIKKGIRGAGRVIKGVRDSLGRHANKVTPKQYQQVYQEAEVKHAVAPEAVPATAKTEEDLFSSTQELAPPSLEESTESFIDKMVNFEGENLNRAKLNEWATKARIELAYSGAGVEEALKEKYSGETAIDGALTKEIRADILQAQALKGKTLGAESAAKGYVTIDDLGVARVVEDKDNLAAFMKVVKDLGDKIGIDKARHAIQAYLTATRYQSWLELNETREEELYVSPEQNAAIEPALKFGKAYPEIKKAAAIYERVKNHEVDLLEKAGIYSAEQADLYRKTKGYVPLFRVMDDIENAAPGAKQYFRGFTDIPAEKHATGSARQVEDIFNNMVTRHLWAVEASTRNRANLAQANQLGLTDAKGELLMTANQVEGTEGYSAPVWVNGKRKWVQYSDPNFVAGLEGLEPALGPLMQFFGSASRILRMGVTMLPTFQVTQVFNDAPRAALYSGVDRPFKLMGQVLDSFKTVLTDPNDPFVKQMKALGITGGYEQTATEVANKLRREMGTQSTTKIQKFLDKLERIASASDMAQRRALFKQTMEETGNEALALDRALNIINFQKHGKNAKVRALTQVIPFMNAYIQGMDVMLSAMSGRGISNKQKQIAKMMFLQTGMKLAAISALYSMLVAGDDDYEKLDDREKVRSLIIPGTGFSIPVASDIGMLVKAVPELTYNYIVREGTDNPMDSTKLFKGIGQSFADGLLGPNITPQAFRAGIEVALNKNFLTGNPIVGRGLENLETSQQFTENTSRLARLIGETGILSPMKADHLMKGYGGTAASLALFVMDGMINQVADVKTPSTPLNKIPGIGAFVYSDQGKDQLNDYYDLKERSDEVTATLNNIRKYGSPEEAREYAKENIEMLQVRNQVNAINNRIKAMRDTRKKIIGSNMSADEKAQRIEEIDKNILAAVQNIGKIRIRAGL